MQHSKTNAAQGKSSQAKGTRAGTAHGAQASRSKPGRGSGVALQRRSTRHSAVLLRRPTSDCSTLGASAQPRVRPAQDRQAAAHASAEAQARAQAGALHAQAARTLSQGCAEATQRRERRSTHAGGCERSSTTGRRAPHGRSRCAPARACRHDCKRSRLVPCMPACNSSGSRRTPPGTPRRPPWRGSSGAQRGAQRSAAAAAGFSARRRCSECARARARLCTAAASSAWRTHCGARSCATPRVRCCGLPGGGRGGMRDCFVCALPTRARPLQSTRDGCAAQVRHTCAGAWSAALR